MANIFELSKDSVVLIGEHGNDGYIDLCFACLRARGHPTRRRTAHEENQAARASQDRPDSMHD
jgi:hypothetical protein